MASITFWARADSATANNNELNPIGNGNNGVPAFQLTFFNDDPDVPGQDTTGDLELDGFNGLTDPDTMVLIGGVRYPFTYTVQGTLPVAGQQGAQQVPREHLGDQVGVIRVIINGVAKEYFFVLDGSGTESSMNAFGDGAISLTNIDYTPCFCAGTRILTPSGERLVETLVAGDWVTVADGAARQVIWVGSTRVTAAALVANRSLRPVVIPADALRPGVPNQDLHVSPQHRICFETPVGELLFGSSQVLVPALHLAGSIAEIAAPTEDVVYFHVLLEDHDMLVSNGLVSESFQPARRMIDVMDLPARMRLEAVIAALGDSALLHRQDRFPSLKRHEAQVLLHAISVAARAPVSWAAQGIAAVSRH
jgi:Hint domain